LKRACFVFYQPYIPVFLSLLPSLLALNGVLFLATVSLVKLPVTFWLVQSLIFYSPLIAAEFRGPGVHHNFDDSDSGYDLEDQKQGKPFGIGGYRGRIIFLGDGTEVLTDSDDTEMFDNSEEDKDLDSQVSKGSSSTSQEGGSEAAAAAAASSASSQPQQAEIKVEESKNGADAVQAKKDVA
jgi:hypothetical protein